MPTTLPMKGLGSGLLGMPPPPMPTRPLLSPTSIRSRNDHITEYAPGWFKGAVEAETADAFEMAVAAQKKHLFALQSMEPPMVRAGSPVFIDISEDGKMTVGPRPAPKPEPLVSTTDIKNGVIYA